MCLTDLFLEFIDLKSVIYSPETMRSKLSNFKTHIKPILGTVDILDIKYHVMQSLLNDMVKNGYAPKTAAHVRDILKTVFEYAFINEYISKDVTFGLKVRKIDNKRSLTLSDIQIKSFIHNVRFEPNALWRSFFLFLLGGRRLNEAKSLQWEWIDLDRKQVVIPALSSKDRKSHAYGLSDLFIASLNSLPVVSPYVFASPVTCGKLQCVKRSFQKLLIRSNIEIGSFRVHDIRHLVGSVSIRSGMSLDSVRESLGHSSYQTTLRYVTADTSKSRKTSNFISTFCD
jgi:integrase